MKVIAMYLPQFHRVKENDEWWGEGFTEWTSARTAEPLFESHYQPHIPLNNNYYDLLEKETMQWQADLLHQYNVDGMCMYHYWFKDGRQILEKPMENLLKWTDINMPFCICWANTPWARTWSKFSGTPWAVKFEPKRKAGDKEILLEQDYGTHKQWKEHFEYLLPFFKDDRYMKIDGKPIFLFFDTKLVDCLDEMLECWRKLARENGFEGIYVIGAGANRNCFHSVDAILKDQPRVAFARLNAFSSFTKGAKRIPYDVLWKQILSEGKEQIKTYSCGLVGFDTTPRQGEKGEIIEGSTPEKFKMYFRSLLAQNEVAGNDMVFINAWNEWGEGAHLEPDEMWGYGFLEAVRDAKATYQTEMSYYLDDRTKDEEIDIYKTLWDKSEYNLQIMNKWMYLREENISIARYLNGKNVKSVAIYGYGLLSKHLIWELEQAKIEIKYIIDQRGNAVQTSYLVYTPNDNMPEADLIIVAVPYYFHEVMESFHKKGIKNIVSLERMLTEIENKMLLNININS